MRQGQNRGVLEANLAPILEQFAPNKEQSQKVIDRMTHFNILPGEVRGYLNNPKNLYQADLRVLCLLDEAMYILTKQKSIDPLEYFTQQEINTSHVYDQNVIREEERLSLPITFRNFDMVNKDYCGKISVQILKKLLDNQLLYYNFDSQREPSKNKFQDEIILVPKLSPTNIAKMADLMQTEKLETSEICINAVLGTATDGQEIYYDEKKRTITIMPGTRLDILDGYNRAQATLKALSEKPDINFSFTLLVLNTTVARARQHIAQAEKRMTMSEVHRKQLEAPTAGARIVDALKNNYDLQNKITEDNFVRNYELVMASDLARYINENFILKTGKQIQEITKFLDDFFTDLVAEFPDELSLNIEESKTKTLINHEYMFAGYVRLASNMYKNNIPLEHLHDILSHLDLSEEKLSSLITGKTKREAVKNITDFFKSIKFGSANRGV